MIATRWTLLTWLIPLVVVGGCTRILEMEPSFGPPGTPVSIRTGPAVGTPGDQLLKWDGEVIRDPFSGSFRVPMADAGGTPGEHKVTLVDRLDGNEAFMIFPLFRIRHATAVFTVTEDPFASSGESGGGGTEPGEK